MSISAELCLAPSWNIFKIDNDREMIGVSEYIFTDWTDRRIISVRVKRKYGSRQLSSLSGLDSILTLLCLFVCVPVTKENIENMSPPIKFKIVF